ncbi:hypothetical protein LSTR_LSTR003853 [Laodelphax striatellus]|uniref:DUF4794 domain-containing protein n=1 Tax=Laodelphax striatellus TaxID=195883 RepID=A0A482XEP0_LAOST|nr:hypothetical protein LSTR_LSTR003853 [Laodelphax striatellus]
MEGLAWQSGVALVLLALCSRVMSEPEPARLLKVPRIYNALITTDEELTPSQAYPAVAPVLRPAYHPLSYFVYGNGDGDVGGSIIQHNGPAYQDGAQQPNLARFPSLPGQQQPSEEPLPGPQQDQGALPGQQQPQEGQGAPSIYSLQAKQRPPVFDDQVKNNRNPEIPDVPPPPLPVRAPGSGNNNERKPPPNYPPPPSAAIF